MAWRRRPALRPGVRHAAWARPAFSDHRGRTVDRLSTAVLLGRRHPCHGTALAHASARWSPAGDSTVHRTGDLLDLTRRESPLRQTHANAGRAAGTGHTRPRASRARDATNGCTDGNAGDDHRRAFSRSNSPRPGLDSGGHWRSTRVPRRRCCRCTAHVAPVSRRCHRLPRMPKSSLKRRANSGAEPGTYHQRFVASGPTFPGARSSRTLVAE
jgi:hypothetical protein